MTVTVKTNSPRSISVVQGNQAAGTVVVKRAGDITVQGLSNVDSTNLQDGYTIVYDSETNKWYTQQVTATVDNVDGGTY